MKVPYQCCENCLNTKIQNFCSIWPINSFLHNRKLKTHCLQTSYYAASNFESHNIMYIVCISMVSIKLLVPFMKTIKKFIMHTKMPLKLLKFSYTKFIFLFTALLSLTPTSIATNFPIAVQRRQRERKKIFAFHVNWLIYGYLIHFFNLNRHGTSIH